MYTESNSCAATKEIHGFIEEHMWTKIVPNLNSYIKKDVLNISLKLQIQMYNHVVQVFFLYNMYLWFWAGIYGPRIKETKREKYVHNSTRVCVSRFVWRLLMHIIQSRGLLSQISNTAVCPPFVLAMCLRAARLTLFLAFLVMLLHKVRAVLTMAHKSWKGLNLKENYLMPDINIEVGL